MKAHEEVSQVSQKQVFPQSPPGRKNIGKGLGKNLISLTSLTRAQKYVWKMPPAVSGQHGHDQTFAVAVTLLHGFALSEPEAWHVLCEYNERCSPPWSESDLRHKLTDAGRLNRHSKPRGHLLGKSPVHTRPTKAPPRILGRIVLPDTPLPAAPRQLKKVEEPGSSSPKVPTVPIGKKVDQTEEFLTVAETHARNWLPHAALFEWTPVPIECQ